MRVIELEATCFNTIGLVATSFYTQTLSFSYDTGDDDVPGDAITDPDTGEPITDPDSGEPITEP